MHFKYWVTLFCFNLLFGNFCYGQFRLQGSVSDPQYHPVPYATVILSGKSENQVSYADSMGHYVFESIPAYAYQLSVYSIGYEKQTLPVQLAEDTLINFILQPLKKSLNEVTITGTKPVIERRPDKVIFDVTQSIGASGSNGLEALSLAPGIKINNNTISLAGKGDVAVMINGRLLHLSGEALTRYLQSFSAGEIAKIEIITHPSASYDASGNGGIVNMITKHSSEYGFNGDIEGSLMRSLFTNPPNYGVSNYGYANGNMSLNYNNRKWSAYSSLGYTHGRQLEGYAINIYFPERHWAMGDTGDYKHAAVNLLAGADYKISNHSTIGFQYIFENGMYKGADYVHDPVYNPAGSIDSTLRTYAIYYPIDYSNAINLHYLQDMGNSGDKLTINADYFNYYRTDQSALESNSYDSDEKLNPDNTVRYIDTTKQNIRIYTLKADLEIPTSFAQFAVGGKLSFINNYSNIYYYKKLQDSTPLDDNLSDAFQYNENTQAVYISGMKDLNKWKLQAGIRTEITQTKGISYFKNDETDHQYVKFFPSLLISYKSDDNNEFSLTYDKRINRPTFWTLNPYKSIMTAYSYLAGNPYLQPENTTHITLSNTYKSILTSSLWLNITNDGFARVTHAYADSNLIYTLPLNFIYSRSLGVTEAVSANPFRWLESNDQVNFYYTQAHSALSYVNGIKGFGLYLSMNNTIAFNAAKTITGEINFWCQFPEVDHFGKSDTYYNLDLGLKMLTFHKKLTLALTGHDLLQSSGSVVYSTVNNLHQSYTNFQVFSNIRISASYHFGNNSKHKQINTGNESERSRAN